MNYRKKLYKLLNKDLEYTATFVHNRGTQAVLKDVKHKGKFLCDHVCVSYHRILTNLEHGTEVIFNATAHSYRDSNNVRKYGLGKCYNYRPTHENSCDEIVKNDNQNKKKRLS